MSKKNVFDTIVKTVAASAVLSLAIAAYTSKIRVFSLIQQDLFFNGTVGAYCQQFKQKSVLQVTNKDNLKVSFGLDEDLFSNSSVPKLIQIDLFFKRNTVGGREVTESQFQTFVDSVITPRFPTGLTILNANSQFLNSTGTIIEEPSKVVSLIFEDTLENEASVNEIVKEYFRLFSQESVLVAANQDIKVSFGLGKDLIDNSSVPELIQVDLFFGRNIPGGGEITESQFQSFVDSMITPRFPAGVMIFNAKGQFRNSTGTIIEEPSKVVRLILEDTLDNETSVNEIVGKYLQLFNQESVLTVVDEDINVHFVEAEAVPDFFLLLGYFYSALL